MSLFKIKLIFVDGFYAGRRFEFKSTDIVSLCDFVKVADSLSSDMFFELEREDIGFILQVFCKNGSLCAFQDSHKDVIYVFGASNNVPKKMDYIQVWDQRWQITYFLPLESFMSFDKFTTVLNEILTTGKLGNHFEFTQLFPDENPPEGFS